MFLATNLFYSALPSATARLASARDGNIAVLFVFMLSVLLLFAGGALDFTRYNTIRADMTEALDAAGLAIAQYDDVGGPEIDDLSGADREQKLIEFGEAVFAENFSHIDTIEDLNLYFDMTPQRIRPRATGRVKTLLLGIGERLLEKGETVGGLDYLDLDSTVEVTRRGSGRIELALVLDVTGSMDGYAGSEKKINSLKTAVDKLLQVMFKEEETSEFVKIGVVPFNAYVNPGGASSWSSQWSDENADSYYHGARFIHVNGDGDDNGDGLPDIDFDSDVSGTEFNGGVARIFDVDHKVNHFDLYDSMASTDWFGCVEARPYPLDELDTEPGVAVGDSDIVAAYTSLTSAEEPNARMRLAFDRAPSPSLSLSELTTAGNTRWVPMFHPDEPDCPQGGSVCRDDWNWRTNSYSLAGLNRSLQHRGYMFDNPDGDGHDDDAYDNHDFVDDYDLTHYNGHAESFARYTEAVIGFRYVTSLGYSQLNTYWDGVKGRMEALEINDKGIDEYKLRIAYPGWWDETLGRYRGRYDSAMSVDVDETITANDSTMRGPSQDCPAPILPLTSDKSDIADHVATLHPNGNTNSANGALWGWRVVSPEAPFTEGEAWTDGQWQKAVVIMTDGTNVASSDNTHWDSKNTAYGFAIEERMGDGIDRPGRGGFSSSADVTSDRMADHIDEKLLRICRRMKERGVLVYTIVFGLNDAELETVFQTCATSDKAPYYYKAPSGDDLETAFGDIAADLVKLHISQ